MTRVQPHHLSPTPQTARVLLTHKNFGASRGLSHIGLGVAALNTSKTLRSLGYAKQHYEYRLNRKIKKVGVPPRGCEICGMKFELAFTPGGSPTRPRYDHDHGTGAFRGWLCTRCNSAIGMLGDNPAIATAAAAYLKQRGHTVARSLVR